jgi:hypothetical protein
VIGLVAQENYGPERLRLPELQLKTIAGLLEQESSASQENGIHPNPVFIDQA